VPGGPSEGVPSPLVRWDGLCGILGPSVAFAHVFAVALLSPWFRWEANVLSDLGVNSMASFFNRAFLYGGVLTIPFTLGLRAYLPRGHLTDVAAGVLIVGARPSPSSECSRRRPDPLPCPPSGPSFLSRLASSSWAWGCPAADSERGRGLPGSLRSCVGPRPTRSTDWVRGARGL